MKGRDQRAGAGPAAADIFEREELPDAVRDARVTGFGGARMNGTIEPWTPAPPWWLLLLPWMWGVWARMRIARWRSFAHLKKIVRDPDDFDIAMRGTYTPDDRGMIHDVRVEGFDFVIKKGRKYFLDNRAP